MNAGEATSPLRILTKHRTIDLVCENQICFCTNIEIHPHQQLTVRNEKNLRPVDRCIIIGVIHCCLNMLQTNWRPQKLKNLMMLSMRKCTEANWPTMPAICYRLRRCCGASGEIDAVGRRLIVMTLMMTWVCTPAVHRERGRRSCKVEQLRTSTSACNSNSTR